jgi:hypothetical protein
VGSLKSNGTFTVINALGDASAHPYVVNGGGGPAIGLAGRGQRPPRP